jgi:hypothetical protein
MHLGVGFRWLLAAAVLSCGCVDQRPVATPDNVASPSVAPSAPPSSSSPVLTRIERDTITVQGFVVEADEQLPHALQTARGADEAMTIELVSGYSEAALARLLVAAPKAGVKLLRLDLGPRNLLLPLEVPSGQERLIGWTDGDAWWVYDLNAANAKAATLGPFASAEPSAEAALHDQLAAACRKGCNLALELSSTDKPGRTVQLLDSWQRITATIPQLTFRLSVERVKLGATTVSGHLPPVVIQSIVRKKFDKFRACFEKALATNAQLTGRVTARFVIGRDGKVTNVTDGGSAMPVPEVTTCVLQAFETLEFPPPADGIVTVVYPVMFAPG